MFYTTEQYEAERARFEGVPLARLRTARRSLPFKSRTPQQEARKKAITDLIDQKT